MSFTSRHSLQIYNRLYIWRARGFHYQVEIYLLTKMGRHTPSQCITEEADEEASLPPSYVQSHLCPVGVLTHLPLSKRTGLIYSQLLYLYDLELPSSNTIIPRPRDDEVSSFTLMTVQEVKDAMLREEFKPNSALVMMDFFVRHGVLGAEEEGYAEIAMRLRRRLPVAVTPGARY